MRIRSETMLPTINLKLLMLMFAILFFNGSLCAAKMTSAAELYITANRDYNEGRYQKAIEGYLRLFDSGYVNGHLYYNLGNAYFRSGQLGRAILNYKRAELLIPRDADLNFNLR